MKSGESKFVNLVIEKIITKGNNATKGGKNKLNIKIDKCKVKKEKNQGSINRSTTTKNKHENVSCRVRFNEDVKTLENSTPENISNDEIWYSIDDINQMQSQTCDFIQILRRKRTDDFESLELWLSSINTRQHRFLPNRPKYGNSGVNDGNTIRGIEYLIDENKLRTKKKRIHEGVKTVLNEQKKQQQQQQERKGRGRFHDIIRKYKKCDLDLKCALDCDAIAECYIEKGCTIECQEEAYDRGMIHCQDTKPAKRVTKKKTNYCVQNTSTSLLQNTAQINRILIS